MTKKRSDEMKKINAKIHTNTIAYQKKKAEKRRKDKMEVQE